MLLGSAYWPFWLGGLALASVAVGYRLVTGRMLGVSGGFTRLITAAEDPGAERRAKSVAALGEDDLLAAMEAATADARGDAVTPMAANEPPLAKPTTTEFLPATTYVWFMLMIALGGLVASLLSGTFALRTDMGEAFARLIARGPLGIPVLVLGGMLVGFGTRMAGGCTSGHGLCGTSRLEPASLIATASFFGAGIITSFLLEFLA